MSASIGGYRVEEPIGRGGMGVVHRATDLSLGRLVALKLIAPELADDERFRRRFLNESRVAASLDHASIVPIYEAGEDDGRLFLAMRYVEGSDLRTLLGRGPLGAERTFALLEQIASALDAAHRHGLVHRDVKPANVLVDADDHAYLTDFGISKQLGAVTTDTGRLVGSLDYLAPEQIAGEPVDARTDQYALACVLYECLTGRPAFRRETEAETLWAHLQSEYAPVAGREAVFKRAFARRAAARYPSCAELIAAARRPSRRGRGRGRIAAALGLLVASAALSLVIFGGPAAVPDRSGVLALGADGAVASFTAATAAPSNVAVGEGAVWLLDSEAETVARIDLDTKAVKRFTVGGQPTDLAVGEGAVWVATGEGSPRATTAIARVDPRSLKVTATVALSRKMSVYGPGPSEGFPHIAVGTGSVWAVGLDNRIYRIDPGSGRIVARIRVAPLVTTIAAGTEGVWFLTGSDQAVRRIDPATNRIAERLPIKSEWLSGIAVGGGAVWVTSPQDGRLWRIAPGRVRSIHVGGFIQYVGYADGAAWTASYREGVVTRVDDRTGARTTVDVPAAQALAGGAGLAWVSVAGGTRDGALPPTACTGIEAGGARPDVLLASELPLQGPSADVGRALADAIRWVVKDHGYRAGRHVVGYQSCDASTVQTGDYENRRCAANAHAFAHTDDVVAVIGPWVSFCAHHEIPILNRAPGGPLALVSPTNTDPALTRGPPGALYPTGTRNYARVIGRSDVEGVAHALQARRLKLSRVYLLEAGQVDPRALITGPFRRAAQRLGVGIAGSGTYKADPSTHAALAARIADAHPDGVVIDGSSYAGGAQVIKALRTRLGPRAAIMAGDLFSIPDVLRAAGRDARGVYIATTEALPVAGSLTPAGARFVASFGNAAYRPAAMNAAQAAEVVLQAIERSDGTRPSVLRSLQTLRITDGIIGSFAFDRGDIIPARVAIMRITGAVTRDAEVPEIAQGADVERVIEVQADLTG